MINAERRFNFFMVQGNKIRVCVYIEGDVHTESKNNF